MAGDSPAASGCIGVRISYLRVYRPAIEKGTGAWTRDPSSGFLAGLCPLSRKYSPARTHPPSGGRRLAGGSPDTSGRRSAVYGTCGLPFGKGFPQGPVAAMPRGPVAGVEDCLPLRIWRLRPLVPYAKELPQGDRRGATPAATLLTPSLARRSGKDGAAGNRPGRSRPIQQLQLLGQIRPVPTVCWRSVAQEPPRYGTVSGSWAAVPVGCCPQRDRYSAIAS